LGALPRRVRAIGLVLRLLHMDNDNVDWWEPGNNTQDEVDALRRFRARFLDVAIAIEFDIRMMLASYFVADDSKIKLFGDAYEGRGTLGPWFKGSRRFLRRRAKISLLTPAFILRPRRSKWSTGQIS